VKPMQGPYAKLILAWERRLNQVDPDRRLTPFDWGAEWLAQTPMNGVRRWAARAPAAEVVPELADWNQRVLARSAEFFAHEPARDYRLQGGTLSFRSSVPTPYRENHDVHARWFPAAGPPRAAVVVVAQWNADEHGHLGLCRILQRAGVSSLRVSMPYHDRRMPRELKRAEYTVDANIGRTIHAARQAVADIRASLDWLEQQGHSRLGIVGTSLGSCYALLASAHDSRLKVNVFNHVSQYFGDVVWTGLATRHVRQSLEPHLDQEQLREAWRTISPASYLEPFARLCERAPKRNLLIWARYDPCFLPQFSRAVLAAFRGLGLPHQARGLPCGHYTIGKMPFKYADAWLITRFLRRELAG
ncbi:MAG: alpha/beta hydrolase family protein, partial [Terriglobales bacterium]